MSALEKHIDELSEGVSLEGQIPHLLGASLIETLELIPTLFAKIEHGEPGHRAWLKEAIECHFLGKPMPEYVAK